MSDAHPCHKSVVEGYTDRCNAQPPSSVFTGTLSGVGWLSTQCYRDAKPGLQGSTSSHEALSLRIRIPLIEHGQIGFRLWHCQAICFPACLRQVNPPSFQHSEEAFWVTAFETSPFTDRLVLSPATYMYAGVSQPVTRPDSLAEPADRLLHVLGRGTRKGRPEEEILGRLVVFCGEPATSRDQHALVNARVEDLLLYLGYAALPSVRVELVIDAEPLLWGTVSNIGSVRKKFK